MKYLFHVLLATIFILSSCSKEKSKKWVILNLNVVSAKTGLPVESMVWIQYTYQANTGPNYPPQYLTEKIQLGSTVDGKLHAEVDVSTIPEKLQLKVAPYDHEIYIQLPHLKYFYTWSKELDRTETNDITARLTPAYYRYKPYLHNTSCYNETDSLWLYVSHDDNFDRLLPHVFTGCTDGYVDEVMFKSVFKESAKTNFKMVTKKNGILDSTITTQFLEHEIINEFTLEY